MKRYNLGDTVTDGERPYIVAGSYERVADQMDAYGSFVIAPKGRTYVCRCPVGNLYNIHEHRLVPIPPIFPEE
jgi:hypothetical protein